MADTGAIGTGLPPAVGVGRAGQPAGPPADGGNSQRRRLVRRGRALAVGLGFVAPTLLLLGYFMYYPAWVAMVGSFTEWDGFNLSTWVGLDNFREMVNDPAMGKAAVNNVIWAIGKILLAIVPPFVVAELIFHVRSQRLQYVYRTIFVIPIIVPAIVTILLWSFYYRTDGLVNQVLGFVGLDWLAHSWLADQQTALGALVLMGFPWIAPFNLLIFYAGLQAIPREILEAAELDGAGAWRRVRHLDVPLLASQTGLLLTLAVIGSIQAILEPLIMTGGGPNNATLTPVLYLYQQGITFGRFGYSMAVSLALFVIVLVLSVITNRLLRDTSR